MNADPTPIRHAFIILLISPLPTRYGLHRFRFTSDSHQPPRSSHDSSLHGHLASPCVRCVDLILDPPLASHTRSSTIFFVSAHSCTSGPPTPVVVSCCIILPARSYQRQAIATGPLPSIIAYKQAHQHNTVPSSPPQLRPLYAFLTPYCCPLSFSYYRSIITPSSSSSTLPPYRNPTLSS